MENVVNDPIQNYSTVVLTKFEVNFLFIYVAMK